MDTILSGLANNKTTTMGVALAVLTYVQGVGAAFPQDVAGWTQFFVSLSLAALGVLAKDATTGSQPKA